MRRSVHDFLSCTLVLVYFPSIHPSIYSRLSSLDPRSSEHGVWGFRLGLRPSLKRRLPGLVRLPNRESYSGGVSAFFPLVSASGFPDAM